MAQNATLHSIARILILVGGVILLIGAALQLLDTRALIDLAPSVRSLSVFSSAIIGIVVGVLALFGSNKVSSIVWCVILLVLGYLVGSIGGILVFIGALIALIAAVVKT